MIPASGAGLPKAGERFPKSLRLTRRGEFLNVQERGLKATAGVMMALAIRRGDGPTRVGLTVSKKVGNAVQRVRLRRRLRTLFRKRRRQLPSGLDVVLVARRGAAETEYAELERAFESLAQKLRGLFP